MKRTSETRIRQVLSLMKDGKPRTTSQAADEMRVEDPSIISAAMSVAFGRKQLHIVDWVKRRHAGGSLIPMYKVGAGDNMPRPAPPSKAEYRKIQSQKEMQERERLAEEKARPIVAFRDPLIAAFYGEYQREAACQTV